MAVTDRSFLALPSDADHRALQGGVLQQLLRPAAAGRGEGGGPAEVRQNVLQLGAGRGWETMGSPLFVLGAPYAKGTCPLFLGACFEVVPQFAQIISMGRARLANSSQLKCNLGMISAHQLPWKLRTSIFTKKLICS